MRPMKFHERFARPEAFKGPFATSMIWYYHAMLIMSKDTLFGWVVSMVKYHQWSYWGTQNLPCPSPWIVENV